MKWKENRKSSPMDTLIGAGTVFEGDIMSDRSIAIEGRVKGRIMAKGDVVVGSEAVVEAEIATENIEVYGHILGNIKAYGRLEVGATGRITGDITAKALAIKEGGNVNGIIRMADENQVPVQQLPLPASQTDSDSSYH
jgi:cytoskeletal protein CcmA (bactofilin family)